MKQLLTLEDYLSFQYPITLLQIDNVVELWLPDFGRGSSGIESIDLIDGLAELDRIRIATIKFLYREERFIPLPFSANPEEEN